MKIKAVVLVLILMLVVVAPASAAKKRVWKSVPVAVSKTTTGGGSFSVTAKLTGWKQYLNVGFRGVAGTSGATYELTYNSGSTEQGVYGTVKPEEGNVTRSIFLGTCSHGACVSHKNVSNVRLTVTYKTKDGQTIVKKYKVKY